MSSCKGSETINSLVSIIVPVYNAEKYIRECIDSIILQTYKNIEIIIINDGSQDNSGDICDNYALQDSRIKVVHTDNEGPSEARNRGIKISKGNLIQFVDADDRINKYMTERLVLSRNFEADLVLCGYKLFKDNNSVSFNEEVIPNNTYNSSLKEFVKHFPEYFRKKLIHSPCNKLFDANLIKKNNLEFPGNIRNGEDLLFNINYLSLCNNITVIQESLYYYIQYNNPTSLTKRYKINYLENRKLVFNQIESFLMKYIEYAPLNHSLIKEIFTNYVINVLENTVQKDFKESKSKSKEEFSAIIKDHWIRNNLTMFKREKTQEKLIYFLLKLRLSIGLKIYFLMKFLFKKRFTKFYRQLKKIN